MESSRNINASLFNLFYLFKDTKLSRKINHVTLNKPVNTEEDSVIDTQDPVLNDKRPTKNQDLINVNKPIKCS